MNIVSTLAGRNWIREFTIPCCGKTHKFALSDKRDVYSSHPAIRNDLVAFDFMDKEKYTTPFYPCLQVARVVRIFEICGASKYLKEYFDKMNDNA